MTDRNVLLNRKVRIETGSRTKYKGTIDFMDEVGLMFMPDDMDLNPAYIVWNDVRKIMIVENGE